VAAYDRCDNGCCMHIRRGVDELDVDERDKMKAELATQCRSDHR